MTAWSEELSRARATLKLSRRAVAERAAVSEASYARYESGERTPKREALLRVCGALQLSDATTNEVLANAGYAPELTGPIKVIEKRTAGVSSTREALDSYPWVCQLSNEFFEIRAWNLPALQVAEMDFASFENAYERHFLRLAAMPHFRERLTNWDGLIGNMIGFWKQSFDDAADASEASAYFNRLVTDLSRDACEALGHGGGMCSVRHQVDTSPCCTVDRMSYHWRQRFNRFLGMGTWAGAAKFASRSSQPLVLPLALLIGSEKDQPDRPPANGIN